MIREITIQDIADAVLSNDLQEVRSMTSEALNRNGLEFFRKRVTGDGMTLPHKVAAGGAPVEVLEAMLDAGLPVDFSAESPLIKTLLYAAVEKGNAAALKLLIDRGANPNILCRFRPDLKSPAVRSDSAIMAAARYQPGANLHMIEAMIEAGGEFGVMNSRGETCETILLRKISEKEFAEFQSKISLIKIRNMTDENNEPLLVKERKILSL